MIYLLSPLKFGAQIAWLKRQGLVKSNKVKESKTFCATLYEPVW